MARLPQIGDDVTIRVPLCERDGKSGRVFGVFVDYAQARDLAVEENAPVVYMVEFSDFLQWPFAAEELEIHALALEEE